LNFYHRIQKFKHNSKDPNQIIKRLFYFNSKIVAKTNFLRATLGQSNTPNSSLTIAFIQSKPPHKLEKGER
jgi:hypothetical protein